MSPKTARVVILEGKARAALLTRIDESYECLTRLRDAFEHRMSCRKKPCVACEVRVRIHKKSAKELDENLRAIVEGLTAQVVEDIEQARLEANDGAAVSAGSTPNPPRRVRPNAVNASSALLDALVKVGDGWIPLGDLDAEDCAELVSRCERQVASAETARNAFRVIRARLEQSSAKNVRAAYKEGELKALFRGAGDVRRLLK